ncbi:hypothetical protein Syun_022666 [Stephania yunnanensis]|uniref:Uncharacterized protein n=1 Tax=Stephania yunnanensis TaxID=152371 RepID=A0AAP0F9X8_9MAGN
MCYYCYCFTSHHLSHPEPSSSQARLCLRLCVRRNSAFAAAGPYGSEVTRAQDLFGKDFSAKTLIKQDFKMQEPIVCKINQDALDFHRDAHVTKLDDYLVKGEKLIVKKIDGNDLILEDSVEIGDFYLIYLLVDGELHRDIISPLVKTSLPSIEDTRKREHDHELTTGHWDDQHWMGIGMISIDRS